MLADVIIAVQGTDVGEYRTFTIRVMSSPFTEKGNFGSTGIRFNDRLTPVPGLGNLPSLDSYLIFLFASFFPIN